MCVFMHLPYEGFYVYRKEFPDGLTFEVVAEEDAKPKEEEAVKNGKFYSLLHRKQDVSTLN